MLHRPMRTCTAAGRAWMSALNCLHLFKRTFTIACVSSVCRQWESSQSHTSKQASSATLTSTSTNSCDCMLRASRPHWRSAGSISLFGTSQHLRPLWYVTRLHGCQTECCQASQGRGQVPSVGRQHVCVHGAAKQTGKFNLISVCSVYVARKTKTFNDKTTDMF